VCLIAIQIKLAFQFQWHMNFKAAGQASQCPNQTGDAIQIQRLKGQGPGAALGQHLSNAFSLLLFALPGFGHFPPEVVGIKYMSIKQER